MTDIFHKTLFKITRLRLFCILYSGAVVFLAFSMYYDAHDLITNLDYLENAQPCIYVLSRKDGSSDFVPLEDNLPSIEELSSKFHMNPMYISARNSLDVKTGQKISPTLVMTKLSQDQKIYTYYHYIVSYHQMDDKMILKKFDNDSGIYVTDDFLRQNNAGVQSVNPDTEIKFNIPIPLYKINNVLEEADDPSSISNNRIIDEKVNGIVSSNHDIDVLTSSRPYILVPNDMIEQVKDSFPENLKQEYDLSPARITAYQIPCAASELNEMYSDISKIAESDHLEVVSPYLDALESQQHRNVVVKNLLMCGFGCAITSLFIAVYGRLKDKRSILVSAKDQANMGQMNYKERKAYYKKKYSFLLKKIFIILTIEYWVLFGVLQMMNHSFEKDFVLLLFVYFIIIILHKIFFMIKFRIKAIKKYL